MVKKIISFVLVALMVMCIVPGMALADTPNPCENGTCAHVAAIGTTHYDSIKAAVDAANTMSGNITIEMIDNEVVIFDDFELSFIGTSGGVKVYSLINVENNITIDLNGKSITATTGDKNIVLINVQKGGQLVLDDTIGGGSVSVTAGVDTYALLCCLDTSSKMAVNAGSYSLNKCGHGNGMVYAGGSGNVVINGGVFHLENIGYYGPAGNYSPWVLNASGRGDGKYIIVNGGTFNADIINQYYVHEVEMPVDKALQKINENTWTVVDANAYVHEKPKGSDYSRPVGYISLKDAVNAVEALPSNYTDGSGVLTDSEIVGLVTDCSIDKALEVKESFTLILNGKTIIWKGNDTDPMFTVAAGKTLTLPGNFTPKRYGHVFQGLFTDVACTNPYSSAAAGNATKSTGGTDIYAKWDLGTYTVKWIVDDVQIDEDTQKYGTKLSLPAEPTKASATFIGWFTEDGQQAVEGMDFPGEDTTYYALFKENPAPISSGSSGYSGPDVWYIGGNTFGVTTNQVPTSVEIDNVPVSFTMNGNQITVDCIQPGSDWVTVRWGSVSNQRSFTPDANAYCTQAVIPKTGDVSFWAAIAEFLGF